MRQHDVLSAAQGLYELGFAIHWVRPRSKKPVEAKWTTGERKPWAELKRTFKPGMNVGVRLGKASRLGSGFLAVLDCDVKSDDPAHRKQMLAKLMEVCPHPTPYVASGRGKGSQHRYVVTDAPAAPKRLAQSPDKVRVLMPSVKPTPLETRTLTAAELKAGWRIRPAWEISLMGEGQHVVLPPSIHPDTKLPYAWKAPVVADTDFHRFEAKAAAEKEKGEGKFTAVAVDLVASNLPNDILEAIQDGEGVTDRSGELLRVTCSMLKNGFTDDEILSVLTDRENFLGDVAYEHAETESRKRAAQWLRRYTLEKAKRETLAASQFDDVVEESPLDDWEVEAQAAEMAREREDSDDWEDELERGPAEQGGRIKLTMLNVKRILVGTAGPTVFRRNEFAHVDIYGCDVPWGSKQGAEVADIDAVRLRDWFGVRWKMEPSKDLIFDAIAKIADSNRFHPVRDYLNGLTWDGRPRIDTWLKDYVNAKAPEPYLSAVGRKFLVALVARAMRPGVKFDHVLILEGGQGKGKSSALARLAGPWFTDAPLNPADKDSVLTMTSAWIVEMGELAGMRKTDVDSLKAFISRPTDRIRAPYGRKMENYPRQCVFAGTTNPGEYLKDPTGGRRFWPVDVGVCDFERLEKDRDQLFAEAVFAYELGEPLWLETEAMRRGAEREQERRMVSDEWETLITDWLEKDDGDEINVDKKAFRMIDLFGDFGAIPNKSGLDTRDTMRAAVLLRKLGYKKIQRRVWSERCKVWVRNNG